MRYLIKLSPALFISMIFLINGCINVDQTVKINADGSGKINLHYWTKSSNLSLGDEIGGFSFKEEDIKKKFTSSNSDVKNLRIERKESDTTENVFLEIDFKDFNRLAAANGFAGVKSVWQKGDKGWEFIYAVSKDSVDTFNPEMKNYFLNYKFEFPGEVIASNGIKDVNSVTWKKPVSELNTDFEMTASIKSKQGICGLFGYEFIILVSAFLIYNKNFFRRKIKS